MEQQNPNNQNTPTDPPPPTTKNSDDGHHPAAADGGDAAEAEETGNTCQPKKRKGCPSVAEKCEALLKKKNSPLNSNYSFTFDTKICAVSGFPNTLEPTPKFGSFDSGPGSAIKSKEKSKQEGNEESSVD